MKTTDSYYKIRPLFREINQCFKIFLLPSDISIDETMIKYYGKHGTKQFIRGKPIRFGFKLFSLASPAGYLYHAEPYCGSDTQLSEVSFGLGGNSVLSLVQACHVPAGSKLYFDNWFTSLSLLDKLRADGIGGTGTIRADRCEKSPLQTKKELEKKERGSSSYASDGSNLIVRWYDNAVISVASNCELSSTTKLVSRWSRKQKRRIDVPMPQMIHRYNRFMGGEDLIDQFIANYRIRIRSKKWWWPFFSWSVDACLVSAWLMYKSVKKSSISLLDFRREVAQQALKQHETPKLRAGPKVTYRPITTSAIRFDGINHWLVALPSRYSRRRKCGGRCSVKCEKCDAPLYVSCFKVYHEK